MRARSDIDVAVVVESGLGDGAVEQLVAGLDHASLPCPARRLELVVYRLGVARSGGVGPDFELNLNTGAAMDTLVERRGATAEPHWYVVDRSILAQAGEALRGPGAPSVFASAPHSDVVAAVATSIAWFMSADAPAADAILNACRGLRYAREGRWTSKDAAGEWYLSYVGTSDAVRAARRARGACPGREGDAEPPP